MNQHPSASDTKETSDANPEVILAWHSFLSSLVVPHHVFSPGFDSESVCVYLKRKAWTDFALLMDRGRISSVLDTHARMMETCRRAIC